MVDSHDGCLCYNLVLSPQSSRIASRSLQKMQLQPDRQRIGRLSRMWDASVRRYRKLKWLSLVLFGLCVVAWLISSKYDVAGAWNTGVVGIQRGCFVLTVGVPTTPHFLWSPRPPHPGKVFIWKPHIVAHQRNPGGTAMIPLWIPMIVTLAAAWFFHRKARFTRLGHCAKCSYDLSGNESGVCPECGTRT